jgi:hypothetical protein
MEVDNTGMCVKLYRYTLERFLDENNNLKFYIQISNVWIFITDSTKKKSNICHIFIKIK